MIKRVASVVGALGATAAILSLSPGVAMAGGHYWNGCANTNTCTTEGAYQGTATDVSVDADLTNAPGNTLNLWLEVDGKSVCEFSIPEGEPAGSWICPGVPPGANIKLVAGTGDGAPGNIDLGMRWG